MPLDHDPALLRIQRFWEARAREDPLRYSVPGGAPPADEDAFLAAGAATLAAAGELVGWPQDGLRLAVDVGCGAGRLTGALAEAADAVVAIDLAPTMVEAARRRHRDRQNVSWHGGHAGDLRPLANASADAVVALGVLGHLPTVELVLDGLADLARILAPEGALLFDLHDRPPPLTLPGEAPVPDRVARHPLWRGTVVDLETVAAAAHQERLIVERIEGSGSGRCLILARREAG
ncbi:class I SAM-dependent methyltransferase [Patulibacter defluvii]|uniref:class I SAM-dependent methyltransferase n=1 Tax=Patulibacter defluvii TaxID=3095358 RepID=UPI002A760290|nr:class I SAM-dependent methyltransferase [Patulibacter sp. DM4]